MIVLISLVVAGILFVPDNAFAWGPLTHMYLANEILSFSPLIPAGIYALLRQYKQDFLYGNLMADSIIGKKYLSKNKNPHSWEVGLSLLDSAETSHQKAFAYGYLSHLAADTVAHDILTKDTRNFGHSFYEMKADSLVDKSLWFQGAMIEKTVQRRNDLFMEKFLNSFLFSFKTNKRIFKGFYALTFLPHERMSDFIDNRLSLVAIPDREMIEGLREESLDRILDVLQNGKDSPVFEEDPSCQSMPPRRFLKNFRSTFI